MHDPRTKRPVRILHVLGSMNPGGVEVWLMHVLRFIDREKFQMDFYVHSPGRFDAEIESLGSTIIRSVGHKMPWVFARNMWDALHDHGPYDVVHSHLHHYSGVVLTIAKFAGVPIRIAHSHNDLSADGLMKSLSRRAYLELTEQLIQWTATSGIACSEPAAASLFGRTWKQDRRWQVMPCGIDLRPFEVNPGEAGAALRSELRIPENAFVIGHIGSFTRQKNHHFLVEIARTMMRRDRLVHLLLVGDGPLQSEVEAAICEAGIADRVTFAGERDDVPLLMQTVLDVLFFPSLFEGSPLVLVEAQAAGLPAVISDTITDEVVLNDQLITRVSLQSTAEHWADIGFAARREQDELRGMNVVRGSVYDVSNNVEILGTHYLRDDD